MACTGSQIVGNGAAGHAASAVRETVGAELHAELEGAFTKTDVRIYRPFEQQEAV